MRAFSLVDVFTSELLLGNPVAVVHDAEGLTSEQMAALARWTNLSETTFLLPPSDPAADYRLRVFTTTRELPFAGHPTLGSARAWLHAGGTARAEGLVVQECGAGLVPVRHDGARLAFAAPPLRRGGPVEPVEVEHVAQALGLRPEQVIGAQWADNGPGWVALLLDHAESVLAVEPDFGAFGDYPDVGIIGPHAPGAGVDFEVRAFATGLGEDPVTGSLNAALAQWLIPAGLAASSYTVAQGARLGRRGRVYLERLGDVTWVGGDTVLGVSGSVSV